MRRLFALCFIVIGAITTTAAQPAPGEQSVMLSQDGPGGINANVRLQQSSYYLAEPSASVPAQPLTGTAQLIASRFSVRAWMEADMIRVVVYAVIPDPRSAARSLETPIDTFTLTRTGATQVVDTEQWGARPVTVMAIQRVRR